MEAEENKAKEATPPQTPPPATPPRQRGPAYQIKEDAEATVLIEPPAEGGKRFEGKCSRNLAEIDKLLRQHLPPDTPNLKAWRVTVTLPGENMNAGEGEERNVQLDMIRGNGAEAYQALHSRYVRPEETMMALRRFISELCEVTDLAGIMITADFRTAGVSGFTVLNNLVPVADEHCIRLAEGAAGQVDTFKLNMMQKGVRFPDDKVPQIITPDQVRQMAGGPRGRMPPFPGKRR